MDFTRPLRALLPSAEADVLTVLAAADVSLTGRAVARAAGLSIRGAQLGLGRLVRQGVVVREVAGNAHLYRLNQEHLAAGWISGLVSLRLQLIERLRATIAEWRIKPGAAVLFGSIARGEGGADSDLDILLVRATNVDAEHELWRTQVLELERAATEWTGNDARVVEYAERELTGSTRDPLLNDAAFEGVDLHGSLRRLLRSARSRR